MSLPGVTLARVEVRPTGEIVGIHLMVAAGVDTSSLINTVDETLRTTFDLKIAPEQIFVAHVNARSGSSARPADAGVSFHEDRVAMLDELVRARRQQRHATFLRFDLLRDANNHGSH